eukprot:scaffold31_cov263-Pinguiococcus_pyrenoidosus.AAC.65
MGSTFQRRRPHHGHNAAKESATAGSPGILAGVIWRSSRNVPERTRRRPVYPILGRSEQLLFYKL